MSRISGLGIGAGPMGFPDERPLQVESVVRLALNRVLEFTGHSIDDIVNDPVARNEVEGYYRLYCYVERRCDEIRRNRAINTDAFRKAGTVQ